MSGLADGVRGVIRGEVRANEPLARHTTLRVGGPVDLWAAPVDVADVQALCAYAGGSGLSIFPLGAGSNLLVRDGGIRGIAVSLEKLRRVERLAATQVQAEAGVSTGKLLKAATDWELGGLEFLGGVPGSVGGGLIMNAGTYLGEFKDVTRTVHSVDGQGNLQSRRGEDCGFVYRASQLGRGELVVFADFDLRSRPREEIAKDVRSLRDRRKAREPKGVPNAGSFFKNPPGDFAGRLIEAAGLKGRQVGMAQVSPVHANWLVNLGGATAANFLALIAIVRDTVLREAGIALDLEVRVVGDPP